MCQVTARPGESIDSLLKRFKKATDRAGILADCRKHEEFEKPSIKKRRKSAAARKREAKRLAKEAFMRARKDKDRGGVKHFKKRKPRPQSDQPQAQQPTSTLVASSSNVSSANKAAPQQSHTRSVQSQQQQRSPVSQQKPSVPQQQQRPAQQQNRQNNNPPRR